MNSEDNIKCDALGDKINIGSKYGYTTRMGSVSMVVVGVASAIIENGISLEVINQRSFLHDKEIAGLQPSEETKMINVISHILFPVS